MSYTGKFSVIEELVDGIPKGYRLISEDGYKSKLYSHNPEVLSMLTASCNFHNQVRPNNTEWRLAF